MIRIAVLAGSGDRGRALAELLSEDERFDVVDVRTTGAGWEHADVTVVTGFALEQIPEDGSAVVVLSDEAAEGSPFARSVRAWLPSGSSAAQIAAAVIAAAADLAVLTPQQTRQWLRATPAMPDSDSAPVETLTKRELQVLRMLADGLENKAIARQLSISEHTAKFHVAQILAKLRASGRAEAVAIGLRRGLVPI